MFSRWETTQIAVGDTVIGGGHQITVQSMTNTDTRDVATTVRQICELAEAGCDIVRMAIPDMEAANAVKEIRKLSPLPLVADIHFDHRLALRCMECGIDKIRINPGNIGDKARVAEVVRNAKERNIPIRIGVNGGSLDKELLHTYGGICEEAIVESALVHIRILEDLDFSNIVISLKSSDVNQTIRAYELMASRRPYPLHIGLTEAGTPWAGSIKSSVAIGAILSRGIGDTIRVSLTGNPIEEVRVAREILASLELGGRRMIRFISCPTCGRTRIDLISIAGRVERALEQYEKSGKLNKCLTVAVMGCGVNGPGEAAAADIGLAGGNGDALVFEKGTIIGKLHGSEEEIAEQFVQRVIELAEGEAI